MMTKMQLDPKFSDTTCDVFSYDKFREWLPPTLPDDDAKLILLSAMINTHILLTYHRESDVVLQICLYIPQRHAYNTLFNLRKQCFIQFLEYMVIDENIIQRARKIPTFKNYYDYYITYKPNHHHNPWEINESFSKPLPYSYPEHDVIYLPNDTAPFVMPRAHANDSNFTISDVIEPTFTVPMFFNHNNVLYVKKIVYETSSQEYIERNLFVLLSCSPILRALEIIYPDENSNHMPLRIDSRMIARHQTLRSLTLTGNIDYTVESPNIARLAIRKPYKMIHDIGRIYENLEKLCITESPDSLLHNKVGYHLIPNNVKYLILRVLEGAELHTYIPISNKLAHSILDEHTYIHLTRDD